MLHILGLILLLLTVFISGCHSSKDLIPVHLEACYNGSLIALPLTLMSLRDIVLKIENANPLHDAIDIAGHILRRFSCDGIERNPLVTSYAVEDNNVIPFRRSGVQRVRSQLIHDYLLPGFTTPFHVGVLSLVEECTLHFMLSSSINPWERGDEFEVCPSLISGHNAIDTETGARLSPCPVEGGVILAGGQAVSISRFLAGILGIFDPGDRIWEGRVVKTKWATSIAGDLAEVAVFQIGLTQEPWVGASGIWNDTVLPMRFYTFPDNSNFTKHRFWQFTDAEILGDIDGLMIGNLVQRLGVSNLRLSQLLMLFYTTAGADQGFFSAADREKFLPEILNMREEIILQGKLFAKMIQWSTPSLGIKSEQFDSFLEAAFDAFEQRAKAINLGATFKPKNMPVKTSLNVIFDSTFPPHYTVKILYALANGINVWHRGSRLSVINGQTGDIIVRDAHSEGDIWVSWLNASIADKEPSKLSLSTALLGLKTLMNFRLRDICLCDEEEPAYSHVTLVLDISNTLTDSEFSLSSSVLRDILFQHPEMNFTFVTHNQLNIDEVIDLQYKDRVRITNPFYFIEKSLHIISQVERVLIPGPCCTYWTNSDLFLEEVGYPSVFYNFRIPDEYFCNSSTPVLNVLNNVYGTLNVCSGSSKNATDFGCMLVAPNNKGVIALQKIPCAFPPCSGIHFTISVNSSSKDCDDMLCQTSDGVKYSLQLSGLSCVSNLTTICSNSSETIPSILTVLLSFIFVYKLLYS